MHRYARPVTAIVALVLLAGCAAGAAAGASSARSRDAASQTAAESSASSVGALPQGDEPVDLDPADFSTTIDNRYWPMKPGTRWIYEESDEKGVRQRVVVTVTRETKRIANGIEARVVRDTVTEDGQLIEDTKDWYAQDRDGNIWYLGEDTAEFKDGKVTSRAGSFEAGVDGALPGVIIPADPRPGMSYRQEYYEGEAEDNGAVLGTEELVEVPYGGFNGALLTRDTVAIEPGVAEYKLYAPGVGPVLTLKVSGGSGREELVAVEQVSGDAGTGPLGAPR